jgi:hypothetical protein
VQQSTSQYWLGNLPAVGAGPVEILTYKRAGATPALTDTLVYQDAFEWSGTAKVLVANAVDAVEGLTIPTPPSAASIATAVVGKSEFQSLIAALAKIAGLAMENTVSEPINDNTNKSQLNSATYWMYDSKANADLHGKTIETGLLHRYQLENTWSGGVLIKSTFTKIEEV